jgi:membrane-associated phospholipid phosphatase
MAVVGAILALVVAANQVAMNNNDLGLNTWFHDRGTTMAGLADLAAGVSSIGSGRTNIVIVPVVVVVLLVARQWRWAVFLVVVSQGGLVISNAIKQAVARQRPPWQEFDLAEMTSSFPSGHTFAGITIWVAMGIVALYVLPRPWSTVVAVVPIGIGLLNGPSRLVLAKHWVTDVIGAWLLAGAWLMVVWGLFVWFMAPRPRDAGTATPTGQLAG